MNWKLKLGAVLAALAYMALPASAATSAISQHHLTPAAIVVGLAAAAGFALMGTVTATWASFQAIDPGATYAGGTTPPTAGQASQVSYQAISVACTDADTTINLTHNFGLTAAQATAFQPQLIGPFLSALGSGTFQPAITWSFSNTNVLVGTKANAAGSGCTFVVYLRKPAP